MIFNKLNFLLIPLFFLLIGCSKENSFIINTAPLDSQVTFLEVNYETPAKIVFKGSKLVEIKISQEGYLAQKVTLDLQKSERKITVKLEADLKKVIIETIPSNAIIHSLFLKLLN